MTRRKCKKCNSDVVYKKMVRGSWSLIFLLVGGCMMWIPIIGWIAAPICFLLALVMLFAPTYYIITCPTCGEVEVITKKEYEEVTK